MDKRGSQEDHLKKGNYVQSGLYQGFYVGGC